MSLRTSVLSLTTAAVMATGAFAAPVAMAADFPSAGSVPVAELDVNHPDGALAYVFAEPVMQSEIDVVTRQVRELRAKAWDANLPIRTSHDEEYRTFATRDAAQLKGFSTREDYVNGISWNRGIEHAALQRAAEENFDFNHDRLMGVESWTVREAKWNGENLVTADMSGAVGSWAEEWDNVLSGSGETGHLLNMLDPENKYFAQAQVGRIVAGLYVKEPVLEEPGRLDSVRHAFPIAVPESAVRNAELVSSGGTSVGSTGSVGLSTEGFWGAKLGVPVASPSSSDPEVLEVNEDGTYEAKSEGTATVTFTTYELVNGQPQVSDNHVTKTVKVTKKSVGGDLSSGGMNAGTIVAIISGVLALIGVAAQVARQLGILR